MKFDNFDAAVLGQIPAQSVAALTGAQWLQIVSLVLGAAIQITTLYLNYRSKKRRAKDTENEKW